MSVKCGVENKRASLCDIFKFSHKSPMLRVGCRERKRGRAESEEGGDETVVPSQNMTDAKVAGVEEMGEGEREDEREKPSSQSNNPHEWTVTNRALFMTNHLYSSLHLFFFSYSKHCQRYWGLFS